MSFKNRSGVQTVLVVGLFLGAGLFAAGCCCTCPKHVGEKGPEPVNVLVTWDEQHRQITVFPNSVYLCEGRQFARWELLGGPRGGSVEIRFDRGKSPLLPPAGTKKESPAADDPKNQGTQDVFGPGHLVDSGVSAPKTAGRREKYSVSLFDEQKNKIGSVDPWVEIGR